MSEPAGITRRTLAIRGSAGAGALALGGLGALAPMAGAQPAPTDTVVAAAIKLELTLTTVYGAMAASPVTDSANREMARELGRQCALHAARLESLLVGTRAPGGPDRNEVPGLSEVSSQNGFLELALGLENQVYLSYLDALGEFSEPADVLLLAQLAAGTAQHLALLRRALGRVPVPSAFETGTAA